MSNKFFPTIEKFQTEARDSFKAMWPNLSDAEIDAYFATDEAQDVIQDAFKNGSPYAAGYCLSMMY